MYDKCNTLYSKEYIFQSVKFIQHKNKKQKCLFIFFPQKNVLVNNFVLMENIYLIILLEGFHFIIEKSIKPDHFHFMLIAKL